MQIKNTENHYGLVAISLHWVIAILIIGLVILGLYMTGLPKNPEKLKLYGWHKEFGILILVLAMLRIVWRIGSIVPLLPNSIPDWQKLVAHMVHWAFYGFMFAQPITGWLMSSAAGIPVSFFGLFVLPDLISPNDVYKAIFRETHEWLAYAVIVLFFAHVGAALKHHFISKNDVLRKMLP
ncbi:MAG: cytochrome b [Proteobacteria bacterium]|nr:cytochrome b [Pseudomonadota bacterium]